MSFQVFADIRRRFLTWLVFDVKPGPISRRNVLPRAPVAELTLLSTSTCVYCEAVPASATDPGTAQKRSSRALSARSEEQRERDAGCGGDDVLLFAGLRVKRPIHELERANF